MFRQHRLLTVFAIFGVLLVGLFAAAMIAILVWYRSADRAKPQVEQRLSQLREAGIPVDNASVQEWYQLNTVATHTLEWIEVMNHLESAEFQTLSKGIQEFDRKAEGTEWTPTHWPAESQTRALLKAIEPTPEVIHRLAKERVPVQFPIEFDSIRTLLPRTQAMRQVARLVKLEFDVAAADRDSAAIAEAIQTELDLSIVCSGEPFIVSHLVCTAIRGIGLDLLKKALQADLLEGTELDRFAESLPHEPLSLDRLAQIIQGERASCLPMFFDIRKYQSDEGDELERPNGISGLPLRAGYQDVWNYMQFMQSLEDIPTDSLDQAVARAKGIGAKLQRDFKEAGLLGMRDWIVTGMAAPAIETIVVRFCEESVQVRMVLHAIAIRRYQHLNGTFPVDLGELKEVGFDASRWLPLGGQPMGYRIEGENALLWSTLLEDGDTTSTEPPDLNPEAPMHEKRLNFYWKLTP